MAQKTTDNKITELRQGFSEYLKAQGKKSYGTTVSDAFYLHRNNANLDFVGLLEIEDFQQFQGMANEYLKSTLSEKSSAKGNNAGTYLSGMTQLWRYIHGDHSSENRVPSPVLHIPRPSHK